MKYLVGTLCGGLMEDPETYFAEPYQIIDAWTEFGAVRKYNKNNNCSFFSGDVMAKKIGPIWHISSDYVSKEQFKNALHEAENIVK